MRKNSLFLLFVIPVIVDIVGTVIGQPAEYWSSGFKTANEALPIRFLLQVHPLIFIGTCLIIWLTFTFFLVKKLKYPFNLWAAMALFAGHSYNSINWLRISLAKTFHPGSDVMTQTFFLIPVFLYILIIGKIATSGLIKFQNQNENKN